MYSGTKAKIWMQSKVFAMALLLLLSTISLMSTLGSKLLSTPRTKRTPAGDSVSDLASSGKMRLRYRRVRLQNSHAGDKAMFKRYPFTIACHIRRKIGRIRFRD
jgi:hypothetical protein